VARLCRRLDGQPLALELAAARLRVLPLQQVVDRLDDAFSVLVTNARDTTPRHQTLRATLDWSHALLPEPERLFFAALAVFRGGFTLEAAEAVVGPVGPDGAFGLLARLVEKSLVQVRGDGAQERYGLLEVVRQYADTHLGARRSIVTARHGEYYLGMAEQAEHHLATDQQKDWLDRLQRDHDNLRAALGWSWRNDPALGIRLAGALGRYCYLRGHYAEGREWLQEAVVATAPHLPRAAHAKALVRLGMLEFLQADYDRAATRLVLALKLYDENREPRAVAEALQVLGSIAREQGNFVAARSRHEQSLALWRRLDDPGGAARALNALAFVAWLQDDQPRAGRLASEALRAYRDIGDGKGVVWALIHLGASAHRQGDTARARPLLTESLALSRELGFREGTAWSLEQLGSVANTDGAHGEAAALLRQSLAVHHELGDRWRTASVLESVAGLLTTDTTTDARPAAQLLGAAAELRAAIGTPVPPCDLPDLERRRRAVRSALTPEELTAATAQGHAMSLEQAVATALAAADAYRPAAGPSRPAETSGATPAADRAAPARTTPPAHGDAVGLRVYALGRSRVLAGDRLLGTEDWTYAKPRELLYYLLDRPGVSKADIGLALWPDASAGELRNSFHTCLKHLRRALGDLARVRFVDGLYRMDDTSTVDYDVTAFRTAARAALAAGRTADAIPALAEAVSRYPGDFLVDVPVGDWADATRQRLRRGYEQVMLTLGGLRAQDRRFAEAAETFTRLIEHDPLLEAAHRGVMRCHAALGNPARAVRQYQHLAALLAAETGSRPAAETTALFTRLVDQHGAG
jgi:two-component SAPR family response regulator